MNHRAAEMQLAEGFRLPRNLHIKPFGQRPGWGEDSPIVDARLSRDGGRVVQDGEAIEHGIGASLWLEFNPPIVWSKQHHQSRRYELQMHIQGLYQRDGPWYVVEHLVNDRDTGSVISLGSTEWADWCHSGDLVCEGWETISTRFFRQRSTDTAKLLIDLGDRIFREVAPPSDAKQWDAE